MFESRLNVLAHQGNDDEDAEEAVNHAGHGGQKINEKFEGIGNSGRSEFGEKNRGANAERDGDEQRDGGGDERAVDKWEGAELIEDGIPDGSAEKIKAKLVAGKGGALPQVENEKEGDKNDGTGEQKGDEAGDFIALAEAGKKRARARCGARARNSGGGGCQLIQLKLLDLVDGLGFLGYHFLG
jgi:hypothetical protein